MKKPLMALILCTSLATVVALAEGPAGSGFGGPPPGVEPGRMLNHLVQELQLHGEQEQKARAILENARQQSEQDRQRLEELRLALESQVEEFDAGRAGEMAREIGELQGELLYRGVAARAELFSLLDERQREEFRALQQQRRERRDRFRAARGERP